MTWKRRHTFATIFAVLTMVVYIYFFHRMTDVKDANDWHVEFSYLPFHCRVCMGRAEELSYRGAAVAIPAWSWRDYSMGTARVLLLTPVGEYTAYKSVPYWKAGHVYIEVKDATDAIAPDELSQGWYDATGGRPREYYSGPYFRKPGMPAHWCLVATGDTARWIAPDRISAVSW